MKIFRLLQPDHHHLLNGGGPDDEGTPDRILHLLDARVHVVEGDGGGGGGGHVGAGAGEVPGGHDKLLSETHHSAVGCYKHSTRLRLTTCHNKAKVLHVKHLKNENGLSEKTL